MTNETPPPPARHIHNVPDRQGLELLTLSKVEDEMRTAIFLLAIAVDGVGRAISKKELTKDGGKFSVIAFLVFAVMDIIDFLRG